MAATDFTFFDPPLPLASQLAHQPSQLSSDASDERDYNISARGHRLYVSDSQETEAASVLESGTLPDDSPPSPPPPATDEERAIARWGRGASVEQLEETIRHCTTTEPDRPVIPFHFLKWTAGQPWPKPHWPSGRCPVSGMLVRRIVFGDQGLAIATVPYYHPLQDTPGSKAARAARRAAEAAAAAAIPEVFTTVAPDDSAAAAPAASAAAASAAPPLTLEATQPVP